jgi:broad specificity phosphatase PhoE
LYAPIYQQWRRVFFLDPPLTQYGKDQTVGMSAAVKGYVPQVDIVASSVLLRSIQTALTLFPDTSVNVIPYVSEIYTGMGNYASPKSYQLEVLQNDNDDISKQQNVNYDHIDDFNVNISDYSQFLQWLKDEASKLDQEDVYVALVTHSGFISTNLNIEKVHNNAIVLQEYSEDAETDTLKPVKPPVIIFEGFSPPTLDLYKAADGHKGGLHKHVIY